MDSVSFTRQEKTISSPLQLGNPFGQAAAAGNNAQFFRFHSMIQNCCGGTSLSCKLCSSTTTKFGFHETEGYSARPEIGAKNVC